MSFGSGFGGFGSTTNQQQGTGFGGFGSSANNNNTGGKSSSLPSYSLPSATWARDEQHQTRHQHLQQSVVLTSHFCISRLWIHKHWFWQQQQRSRFESIRRWQQCRYWWLRRYVSLLDCACLGLMPADWLFCFLHPPEPLSWPWSFSTHPPLSFLLQQRTLAVQH